MLDIIGRAFPSKYQIIFVKLILSILIIVFEISLSQIHFLYQKTPYIFYTFIYFCFLAIFKIVLISSSSIEMYFVKL